MTSNRFSDTSPEAVSYSDDENDISADGLLALENEMPVLAALRNFTDRALRVNWFTELGEPLNPQALKFAQQYIDAMGFPDTDIAILSDWADAATAAESLDLNSESWEAEEQLRAGLLQDALSIVSEEGLGVVLTHMASAVNEAAENCLEEALYYGDESVDLFGKLALGAAHQACHGAALAIAGLAARAQTDNSLSLEDEIEAHPLMLRFRLFEEGRWPVSLIGRSFNIF
ncbi:MAG: hypothetical protein ACON41_05185 [Parvibaculales bacterium]